VFEHIGQCPLKKISTQRIFMALSADVGAAYDIITLSTHQIVLHSKQTPNLETAYSPGDSHYNAHPYTSTLSIRGRQPFFYY